MNKNKSVNRERYIQACLRLRIDIDDGGTSSNDSSDDGRPDSQRRLPFIDEKRTDDTELEL